MRIIAGTLKGRRLRAPDGLSVRPTADRAREALFSVLQKWPRGAFLDLFGGTGAVALEAFSRGYAPVACVEKDPQALACLKANLRGAELAILAQDVMRLGADAFRDQAVIFLDPPYAAWTETWAALAPRLGTWLAPTGVLVFETAAGTAFPPCPDLEPLEVRRYGAAEFHLFRRPG